VAATFDFAAADMATAGNGRWLHFPERAIERFHFDSREVAPGTCFVALQTGVRDGHAFLGAAKANGAVAALVSEPQPDLALAQLCVADTLQSLHSIAAAHRQRFNRPLAAITGSFGKTSTKELLTCMLGESATASTPGNWNNHIGVPLSLLQIDPANHSYAVIEAGISASGEMLPLAKLARATHVLFTGIGPAHLEALGNEAGVAVEKFELAAHAAVEAILFFPYECLDYEPFQQTRRPCQVLTEEGAIIKEGCLPANAQLKRYTSRSDGMGNREVILSLNETTRLSFTLASDSDGMARNAALAALVALAMGANPLQIKTGAGRWRADSKRGYWRIGNDGRRWFIDCYNANPTAMQDALGTFLRATTDGEDRRLFVLGTMLELGDRSAALHRESLAKCQFNLTDCFLLIGSSGLCDAYAEAIVAQGGLPQQIQQLDQTPPELPESLRQASCIFLKASRAHCLEQLVADGN
jgi:UDP-N-acetylmuramoyl-tripeptide--D-alanyl-D-alanine ligase